MRLIQILLFIFLISPVFAQKGSDVDFIKVEAEITPIFNAKEIWGTVTYDFKTTAKVDSIFLDAVNMDFFHVSLDRKQIAYTNTGKQIVFKAPHRLGEHRLFMRYVAKPKQTVYFIGKDSSLLSQQFWTQGQGKYTSHWLPSFDDMTEKVEFDLILNTDEEHMAIANGKLIKKNTDEGLTDWHFDMTKPMSSYLAAFVIGNFYKKELKSSSGVPVELYYEPKDSLRVEPTYRYTKKIFDFLEKEIGVPYPWQNYKQVPVQDFLYAGMENTSITVFSNQYMIDSTAFVDKNYVNVNAHELAHQWFGNLVTEKSGEHHWLHEGFATYYAYLAEQHLFGDDHFYWKLYKTAKTLHNLSENGGGEALTNPNANSLTFYEKGAWALVMLKDYVGDKAFRIGIRNYLNKHEFANVTIEDFLTEIALASGKSLSEFEKKWLNSDDFPWEDVKRKLIRDSESIALVFAMEEEFQKNKSDDLDYEAYWDKSKSIYFRQYLVKEYHRTLPASVIDKAFATGNTQIRRELSSTLYGISGARPSTKKIKQQFESLLEDPSYVTIENALIKLWSTFPAERSVYLSKTKDIVGLPNKNVRLLWLTLAMITEDYETGRKQEFYNELNGYTSLNNHFEVRQLAFQYLSQIQALGDDALVNLVKASLHHVWQFKKSSRNLLKELSESKVYKKRLEHISNLLNTEEKKALNKILNP